MAPTLEVKTAEQVLAILGDPRRARILEILTKQQASAKELALMIDETPQSTHYHTKQLEKVGLIRIVETREVKGILEKLYRAVADRFVISRAVGEELGRGMGFWLRWVQEMVQLSDYYLDTTAQNVGFGGLNIIISSRERMQEFEQRLKALQADFVGGNDDAASQRYVLALGLFPIPPDIALPQDTSAFLTAEEGAELDLA